MKLPLTEGDRECVGDVVYEPLCVPLTDALWHAL